MEVRLLLLVVTVLQVLWRRSWHGLMLGGCSGGLLVSSSHLLVPSTGRSHHRYFLSPDLLAGLAQVGINAMKHGLLGVLFDLNNIFKASGVDTSVSDDLVDVGFHTEVLLRVALVGKGFLALSRNVGPSESLIGVQAVITKKSRVELGDGTHLRVEEGVPQEEFFTLHEAVLLGKLVPLLGLGTNSELVQLLLLGGELVDESGSNFEVGPARVQELKGLKERPAVLPHEIVGDDARGTALAADGVDEYGLSCIYGLFYKFEELVCRLVFWVKEDLRSVKKNLTAAYLVFLI